MAPGEHGCIRKDPQVVLGAVGKAYMLDIYNVVSGKYRGCMYNAKLGHVAAVRTDDKDCVADRS